MTTTLETGPAVTAFAAAVRRELADLGPDVIDELTDGLEADLTDKLDDGAELGDPAAYARELREAAGLGALDRPSAWGRFREDIGELRSKLAPLLETPFVAGVVAFLVSLRPVWWVLRAWVIFALFTSGSGTQGVPRNQWDWPVLIALVVVSVQWGRGLWLPRRWKRGLVIAVTVLAILAVPAAVANLNARFSYADSFDPDDYISQGILLDGSQVLNIFAYGPDGHQLEDVRLYDQDGRPLATVTDLWGPSYSYPLAVDSYLVPSDEVDGDGWNVYPLETVSQSALDEMGAVERNAYREPARPPFSTIQELIGYEPPAEATEAAPQG